MSTVIRRGLVLAALLAAMPAVAHAAEVTAKAVCSICGGICPLG